MENSLIERAKRFVRARAYDRAVRAILDTAPIRPRDDGLILFSMIGRRVVLPYLVAIKSLHHQLGRGRVMLLDDGTLTAANRAVLAHHLGNSAIRSLHDVDTRDCPRGGTWERLLSILDLRVDDYVIQLDSDTVTIGPVPDVSAAIDANRSFTLRGGPRAEILPLEAFCEAAATRDCHLDANVHVQEAIEGAMYDVRIPGLAAPRYARGCSGFAGFSRNADGRGVAEAFSREATRLLGAARWARWGSEQVTSNFVILNEPDATLLRYDRYLNHWEDALPDSARFVHFVGSRRYANGNYVRYSRRAIADLGAPSSTDSRGYVA